MKINVIHSDSYEILHVGSNPLFIFSSFFHLKRKKNCRPMIDLVSVLAMSIRYRIENKVNTSGSLFPRDIRKKN